MIRLEPAYQSYIWGGERISSYFKRDLRPGRYAESWEVSDRFEGMSLVGNGHFKGKTLREFLDLHGEKEKFPLLVKLIDAKEHLSVQVHPDETASIDLKAEPKTEMWIALEKSTVYAGLKPKACREEFLKAIEEKRLTDLLQQHTLEKGEFLYIPAGVIHAIKAGAFLLEVQQNSNTTYRLYDWGREGRELHLEKGLFCVDFSKQQIQKSSPKTPFEGGQMLVSNSYFEVQRLDVQECLRVPRSNSYQILFCVSGKARFKDEVILPGMTHFIPKSADAVVISGPSEFILVKQA